MKISVVIPAYNEERHIASCLESLKKQTEQPDEIIVVDNNCKDQTAPIAKRYGARIIKEKRQGMIYARNRGFDSAQYNVIARLDADTRPPPSWIERIKKRLEQSSSADALVGPILFYDLPFKTTLFSRVFIVFMRLALGHHTLIGPNMVLKKNMWRRIRNSVCLDDMRVHEDIDLGIHVARSGGIIRYDPELISYISGRRIQSNPLSFFLEYPLRIFKTFAQPHEAS